MIRPTDRVSRFSKTNGSNRVGSGRVGSGRVGSGRVGSGRVGSGWVGPDQAVFNFRRSDRGDPREVKCLYNFEVVCLQERDGGLLGLYQPSNFRGKVNGTIYTMKA